MLTITPGAYAAICEAAADAGVPPDGGLRVDRSAEEPDTFLLHLVARPRAADAVFDCEEIRVFMEVKVLEALESFILDVEALPGPDGSPMSNFFLVPQALQEPIPQDASSQEPSSQETALEGPPPSDRPPDGQPARDGPSQPA